MNLLENGHILKFPEHLTFTDDELFAFCQKNPELNIERDKHLNLIIMSPTGSLTGNINSKILIRLGIWNDEMNSGRVFDSSTGFTLPDRSMRSPDVSWVSNEQWDKLTLDQKMKFAPVCPEFVVEVKSPSDSLKELKNKMTEWMANGVRLAWLIDTEEHKVNIYNKNGSRQVIESFDTKLGGGDVLPGFQFDLSLLKEV
ncbi:MAG: Uma2 family endonuclease [Cyclobacteriaceae bacterium]|nr:Uma2 family endonuclease [Cyclobacteriaceae bacterium SS2]